MTDMKIRDEELSAYVTQAVSLGACIENRISALKAQLETVCNSGITSGAFHDNLLLFTELLSSIQGQTEEQVGKAAAEIGIYLDSIDYLDGQFY